MDISVGAFDLIYPYRSKKTLDVLNVSTPNVPRIFPVPASHKKIFCRHPAGMFRVGSKTYIP